jgi:uncharacterized membrane protein YjgN (DUF898 family)
MEIISETITESEYVPKEYKLSFHGEGNQYFGIWIVNLLLTFITFGFYYPWARAAKLQYFYQETELDNSRFQFHGTGKEMFLGFIKLIGIIVTLLGSLGLIMYFGSFLGVIALLIFFAIIICMVPFFLHGSAKYRASRISWRGVHFGYRGNLKELLEICLVGGFLTLITFRIYTSWMTCDIRRYMIGNLRFGNMQFRFKGQGIDLFKVHFVGIFLTAFTFGVYFFWYRKDLYNFYLDNIEARQDGRLLRFRGNATGQGFLSLLVGNFFMTIFSLGLATPWASIRTMSYILHNAEIEGDFRPDELKQTESEYKDAMGDDLADIIDIGIF